MTGGYVSAIAADRPLKWRQWRMMWQHLLLAAGLLLFLAALPLPALVAGPPDARGGREPVSGLACLLFGVQFYPSNALLLLSPLWAWLLARRRGPGAQTALAVLAVASAALVLSVPLSQPPERVFIGCRLWAAAHCSVAAALCVPVWAGRS